MIRHGVGVTAKNQMSFLPADMVADNIASLFKEPELPARTLHLTVDDYYNIEDVTRVISRKYGYRFTYFDIPGFMKQMNQRCTQEDLLYPLTDFFIRSQDKLAAMAAQALRQHDVPQGPGPGRRARRPEPRGDGDPHHGAHAARGDHRASRRTGRAGQRGVGATGDPAARPGAPSATCRDRQLQQGDQERRAHDRHQPRQASPRPAGAWWRSTRRCRRR